MVKPGTIRPAGGYVASSQGQRFGLRSRLIGWIAAYALVLQAALAGAVATQMSTSADPFAICYGGSSDSSHGNSDKPVVHQACAICAIASFAAPLPEATHAVTIAFEATTTFHPAAIVFAPGDGWHNPRSSQGPPRNV
jgi:hypothetical protein